MFLSFLVLSLLRPHCRGRKLLLHLITLWDTHTHTHTHTHTPRDFSGRGFGSTQRPLPDKTSHSQGTDIHAVSGIRTRNPSKLAAADQRLRPRGHWDRQGNILLVNMSDNGIRMCGLKDVSSSDTGHIGRYDHWLYCCAVSACVRFSQI